MRVLRSALRFVIAAAVLAYVTWRLLLLGALPLAPHALAIGPQQFTAKVLSVVWWLAVAAAMNAATSLVFAALARTRGSNGERALSFARDALGIAYFAIAAIAISAFVFELPISTVFATSSILAVVLGFALQNTVGDLLSGLALSIEQPFRVGDRIDLGERASGRVVEMNWRATRILAISGDVVVMPNSLLSRSRIINHDASVAAHRASVLVKIGLEHEPTRVCDVLRSAAMSAAGVLATPPPRVEVAAYGDWAIEYKILFYLKDWGDESLVASNIYSALWSHRAWAEIGHPMPHTAVMHRKAEEPSTIEALIERLPMFAEMGAHERSQLAEQLTPRVVARGTRLIDQGASGQSLFIVREGTFSVLVRDADGMEREVARLFPGDYVGEASLLTGAPRSATVAALTGGAVYEIDKTHLEPFLIARPEIAIQLAGILVSREADRDAALVVTNGNGSSRLTALANQIRQFFHH